MAPSVTGAFVSVLTVLIPFIGYPRTLNALQALDEITRG